MKISKRMQELKSETAFSVGVEAAAHEKKTGQHIFKFQIGQPDFRTPDNICYKAIEAIVSGKHGYTPSPGIAPLQETVANYYTRTRGVPIEAGDVAVANGAKQFIGYTIAAVTDCGEGHEVIYPNPGYPIYEAKTIDLGAVPVALPLREKNKFNFDIDELGRTVNEKTRLLILNSPQNPTGGVLSREELEAIAKIVLKYPELWVLSDEIYSRLVYDKKFESISSIPGMLPRTVIMDGVSKTYAMTGWRIGFAANKALAKYFGKQITVNEGCAGHISQWAAVEALNGSQDGANEMLRIFKERRDFIVDGLNKIPGVTCLLPGGAFYVYPNVTEACKIVGAKNSDDFRKRLLYEANVCVTADIHFGPQVPNDGEHIRFSCASSLEEITGGLAAMDAWIRSHIK
jgi:aspartate/methionine/tyrosine aminotransferase